MENQVFIRKAFGDYEYNDKLRSGKFWEIRAEDIVIRFPGSRSKKEVIEHAKANFGWDAAVYEKVN